MSSCRRYARAKCVTRCKSAAKLSCVACGKRPSVRPYCWFAWKRKMKYCRRAKMSMSAKKWSWTTMIFWCAISRRPTAGRLSSTKRPPWTVVALWPSAIQRCCSRPFTTVCRAWNAATYGCIWPNSFPLILHRWTRRNSPTTIHRIMCCWRAWPSISMRYSLIWDALFPIINITRRHWVLDNCLCSTYWRHIPFWIPNWAIVRDSGLFVVFCCCM